MINNNITLTGIIDWKITDSNNQLKNKGTIKNLIMNLAKAAVANYLIDSSSTGFKYIAVGTDNTAASATQTALLAEVTDCGLTRKLATLSRRITTNVANDTAEMETVFTVTGSKTIKELGLFNAASSGTMFSRQVTTINVDNNDKLTITWKIIIS